VGCLGFLYRLNYRVVDTLHNDLQEINPTAVVNSGFTLLFSFRREFRCTDDVRSESEKL
jgi:hypothetical protein